MPNQYVIVEDEALRDGFTQIPNPILRNPAVSPGAKVVYGLLLSYAWQDDSCYPGQERLAEDMGVTERSVITYLKHLVEASLITIKRRGLGQTNIYILHRVRSENFSLQEVKEDLAPRSENFSSQEVKKSAPPEVKNFHPTNTQTKKTQEKKTFEASKASPANFFVDNSGNNPPNTNSPTIVNREDNGAVPGCYTRKRADLPAHVMVPLTRLMEDLSRDLNDGDHLRSNISRAANLYAEYATDVDSFFVTAYEARTFARHQVNARSRMALFFAALERHLKGVVAINEGYAHQEPGGGV